LDILSKPDVNRLSILDRRFIVRRRFNLIGHRDYGFRYLPFRANALSAACDICLFACQPRNSSQNDQYQNEISIG
jgi:hypothetical protein